MRPHTVFALILLAFFGVVIVISLGYDQRDKLFPLIIAIPTAFIAVVQIVEEVRARTKSQVVPDEKQVARQGVFRGYGAVLGWIAGLLVATYALGLLIGFPLFTFLYLKLHRVGWLLSITLALAIAGLVYGGFAIAFEMPLYKGLVFMLKS